MSVQDRPATENHDGGDTDDRRPRDLLRQFSDKWQVADDVENADIIDVESERAIRREHHRLHVEEEIERNSVFPVSTYETNTTGKKSFDDRYSYAPQGWEDRTVEFIEKEQPPESCPDCGGERVVTCPECRSKGTVQCPTCDGNLTTGCNECRETGVVDCSECNGAGTVSRGGEEVRCSNCAGAGETQCSRCGGSGTHTCTQCGGDGRVRCDECGGSGETTCSTCEGDGKIVTADHGSLEFTYETENEYETQSVPKRYIGEDAGQRANADLKTNDAEPSVGGEGTYRHQVIRYDVPARTIEYEYDGEQYECYEIEGELHGDTYPKSRTRKVLTVVGVALVLLLCVGVAWMLGFLPM